MTEPRFFPTSAEFRTWLEKHQGTEPELLVGFHRAASRRPSMSWADAVDEALCFGWIDGVRRGLDDASFEIDLDARLRADPGAHEFFMALPPGHRKQVVAWVTQAKRDETRVKRLTRVADASAAGRRIDLLNPA